MTDQTPANPNTPTAARTSTSALWSLICGIAGILFCLPAIPAVILGIIGLVKIKKSAGTLKGTGMAIAGLIMGGLGVLMIPVMLIIASIAIPAALKAKDSALNMTAQVQIIAIQTALEQYNAETGAYPTTEQGIQILESGEMKYLENVMNDPWGRQYKYRFPGERNKEGYDLWSAGPDGADNTADDITNWDAE
ncbi:MAG: type II secretion system protein GspG [Planctomycetota bacterium]